MITRRNFIAAATSGAALAGYAPRAFGGLPPTTGELTTIYRNARIWTGVSNAAWTDAIGVAGDRIAALGSADVARRRGPRTRIIDLAGAFVVPGMTDNHTHFVIGSMMLTQVDLLSAATPDAFKSALAAAAQKLPAGKWLEGFGWDAERWGGELPTRQWIDAHTPNTPVAVTRTDGHTKLVNSLALKLAGIDRHTPDPAGGTILRDSAGEPTGILRDNALELVERVIPPASDAEVDAAVKLGIARALSRGVTQAHGTDLDWTAHHAFRRLRAAGEPGMRFYSLVPAQDWEKLAELIRSDGRGDDWVRWGGVKAFVDGSLGSRTAYMDAPYADDPHNHGLVRQPAEVLKGWIAGADAAGLQVACHAIGTAANELALDIFAEVAARNGPRDRRFRIEHAQHLLDRSIPRFKAQQVIASMQPYHAIDDGRWAARPLGENRLHGSWAFRSLLDAGATVTFGSDWPVAPLDPLAGIQAAVLRQTTDGRYPGGFVPEQRVTVAEALHAYTAANAFAGFQEDRLGTIATGKLADFVVLAENPAEVAPAKIAKVEVLSTIVGGVERFTRTA
ncbi:MAG: amidohydrolase [Candidatus Sphingomonas colombiensis]|nr:amidohydrolase [Sphingomonas sp.]WEK42004.1 MAG: amidohydrolase [Sphingomonas sp.]